MFSRLINTNSGVTTNEIDRSMKLSEIVEASRPFYKWVDENREVPELYDGWEPLIKDYHSSQEIEWTEQLAVPSPYGYMGYDIIGPPVPKSQPVQFGSGFITFDSPKKSDDEQSTFLDWMLEEMEELDSEEEEEDDEDDRVEQDRAVRFIQRTVRERWTRVRKRQMSVNFAIENLCAVVADEEEVFLDVVEHEKAARVIQREVRERWARLRKRQMSVNSAIDNLRARGEGSGKYI